MNKILFICSCLEIGKDGIGDYTRKLAASCALEGFKTSIIALYDPFIEFNLLEKEELRISKKEIPSIRQEISSSFIHKFKPDCISIQFMPYGFNTRGIVLDQIQLFKKLTYNYKVQIMFHELWIGEEQGASTKDKLIGKIQKFCLLSFVKYLKPKVVHTSIPLYQKILKVNRVNVHLLPLFSNIQISYMPDYSWLYDEIVREVPAFSVKSRNDYILFGIFGSWYENWNLESLLFKINQEFKSSDKKIIFSSIGHLGNALERWNILKKKYNSITFIILGRKSENKISEYLQFIDFGVATTPLVLLGKSGSYLAMKEHGLPVFCDTNKFKFNFDWEVQQFVEEVNIVSEKPVNFNNIHKRLPSSQLTSITRQFILDIFKN